MRFERFVDRASRTTPAVVLGVFNPTGVGVVRNLGRADVPVLALDSDPQAVGFTSRYAAHRVIKDPYHDEDGFIRDLAELGQRLPDKAVLFPCQDDHVFVTARRAAELTRSYRLPFSDWDVMSLLAEKEEQVKAAQRAGVGTPATAFIHARDDLAAAAEVVPFPAVLKSSRHLAMRRRHLGKAVRVDRAEHLEAAYLRVEKCGDLLLQEVVPGGDEQLFTLFSYLDAASSPLALFTCHKIRQHPRIFGECRFGESIWVEEVADKGLAVLRELGFHGVSGVEFKLDPRDGELKFMEINARHGLRHTLAAAVGVNISLVAYLDTLGRPIKAPRQVDGPRWIYASRDVPDSLREILRGEMRAGEWLASLRGTRSDGMLALDDPVPGAYELMRHGWRGFRSAASVRLSLGRRA